LGVGLKPVTLFQVDAIDDEIIAELSSKAMVYKTSWDPLPLLKALRSVTSTPRLLNLIKRLELGARNEQIHKRGSPFSQTLSIETGEKYKP
jgi:hypothetical protein